MIIFFATANTSVCGHAQAVRAYGDVKDNSDSGQFLAIQRAGAVALDHPDITTTIAAKYSRRMDLLVAALRAVGFAVAKPRASFFLYARAPRAVVHNCQRTAFTSAEDFSQWLIRELLVSTVPWDDAGAFVRFSVTFVAPGGAAEEQHVVAELQSRLAGCTFEF
jgi:LL-diaminopimelate aminotransferase